MRRDLTMGPLYTTVRQEKRMLRYTYLGSLCILAAFGCGDSVNQATTSGTAANGWLPVSRQSAKPSPTSIEP